MNTKSFILTTPLSEFDIHHPEAYPKVEIIKESPIQETKFGEFMSDNLKKALAKAQELNSRKTSIKSNKEDK